MIDTTLPEPTERHGAPIPTVHPSATTVPGVAGAPDHDGEHSDAAEAIIGERIIFDVTNPEAMARAGARYFTASNHPKVVDLRDAVQVLGALIEHHVPAGRQRDTALHLLEDVQMRANRGIFAPDEYR